MPFASLECGRAESMQTRDGRRTSWDASEPIQGRISSWRDPARATTATTRRQSQEARREQAWGAARQGQTPRLQRPNKGATRRFFDFSRSSLRKQRDGGRRQQRNLIQRTATRVCRQANYQSLVATPVGARSGCNAQGSRNRLYSPRALLLLGGVAFSLSSPLPCCPRVRCDRSHTVLISARCAAAAAATRADTRCWWCGCASLVCVSRPVGVPVC